MNSNYNIMPNVQFIPLPIVQVIPPPIVQFIPPPTVEFIPADPIFIDPSGRQKVYNVFYLGRHITTTVTRDPAVVHEWIFNVRRFNLHHIGSHVVGLAIQTLHPSMSSDRRPAIIGLCIGENCIIFQLRWAPRIPSSLCGFLSDPNIIFVGFRMAFIRQRLQTHWGLVVRNAEDIQKLAKLATGRWDSIPILIARFLGLTPPVRWPPREDVGWSAWDQQELSPEQVTYACANAYLARELRVRISNTGV